MPATEAKLSAIFVNALQQAEQSREVGSLVELFADDATLDNLTAHEAQRGRDGAERFWSQYLDSFETIHSEFTRILESDKHAVLEWQSQGTLATGSAVDYRGVSILEFTSGKIRRFMSYYDSAALISVQPATAAQTVADPNIEAPRRRAK